MRHGSLFSGIGGFDLAAQWMGWENVFHCEWNEFGQKILKHYWPNAISYEDITKSDFTLHRGTIDILTGGFPCQPFSTAGQRKGTDDARYLWPEMLRVIREVQPRYIVGENVRGLVNWSGGLVFDQVCADLESEGYEVLPVLLAAAGVNAPHRRDRIWFVAYASGGGKASNRCSNSNERRGETIILPEDERWESETIQSVGLRSLHGVAIDPNHKRGSDGLGQVQGKDGEVSERNNDAEFSDSDQFNAADPNCSGFQKTGTKQQAAGPTGSGAQGDATDSQRIRLEHGKETGDISEGSGQAQGERSESSESAKTDGSEWNASDSDSQMLEHRNGEGTTGKRTIQKERIKSFDGPGGWEAFPTVSPIHFGDDGLSDRLDSITFPKWRKESIKGAGNAIVPQVALAIFRAIQKLEDNA